MNRIIWPISAVLMTLILATGGVLTARSLQSAPITRKIPGPRVTVTATPSAPVRYITKWRTRTKTIAGSGVPCLELNGKTWFAGGAASGTGIINTTCRIIAVEPYATGTIEVVTADGRAAEYYSPAGGGN